MIKSVASFQLLGVQIDDKLNFDIHVSSLCKSAAKQLNAMIRLKEFLNFNAKKVLVNSYIMSNFNYCPLVWMLCSAKSQFKIESLQKRALRFLYNDFSSSYEKLLDKAGKTTMNVNRLRVLCVEIYKTINKLSPNFMNEIFTLHKSDRSVRNKYKMNLSIHEWNQVTFGSKSLRALGPRIWNNLPYHIKSSENILIFKTMIKNWDGTKCKCSACEV